ncbi:hypothetical protein BDL97_02G155200 [Sphagnum fallax]|nr:hypothetical protein BDL97_02G155200 [Sphagnum fallax]
MTSVGSHGGSLLLIVMKLPFCKVRGEGIYYAHEPYVVIWWFPTQLALLDLQLLEMTRKRYALQNCLKTQGNPTVLFEWYLQQHTRTHAHLQVVPIPLQKASSV